VGERRHGGEDGVGERGLEPVVEAHAAARRCPHADAEGGRERVSGRGVAREQAVELDVEREAGGRLVDPAAHLADRGNGVERRVDLDPVEVTGVPGQPIACREPGWVPLLDEAGVGSARGADHDSSHARVLPG